MKGVILAGGTGSRLYPLTKTTNKHLLPVGMEPMIMNPVRQLLSANIRDILIVSNKEHMGDITDLLGTGELFSCSFTYRIQKEPKGIADALALAEGFAERDSITVILGDNILTHSIAPYVKDFKNLGAKIFLKEVSQPQLYGVAVFKNNIIVRIEEKPKNPLSNLAVIGVYIYDPTVFEKIRTIKPSARGELEITSVNNLYVAEESLSFHTLKGKWADAGTFQSYRYANEILKEINNRIIVDDGDCI